MDSALASLGRNDPRRVFSSLLEELLKQPEILRKPN
jgi:hypothetical protein